MFTRTTIVRVILAFFVLVVVEVRGDVILHGEPIPEPNYKPDEIIVKFDTAVADSLAEQLAAGVPIETLTLTESLDNLNSRYEARKIEAVFKNFYADRQRIEALLQSDEAGLTKRERHLVRRLRRAPEGAVVPDLGRIYKIYFESNQPVPEAAAEYNDDPEVEYAGLNYILRLMVTPNDPNYYPEQWALHNDGNDYPVPGGGTESGTSGCDIDANEAWDIHTGSSEVIVAILDSGVDYGHRDLVYNMWTDANGNYGYDWVNDDNDPMDDLGHGTHCAGTIAASGDNGLDIAGVCWSAKIMALKFMDTNGLGLYDNAAEAIKYATDNGADVISNSWGGVIEPRYPFLKEAIDYAYSQGVIQVASAGNFGNTNHTWPAYYEHMISVAATDSNDDRASFSTYGDWVDIAAPGDDILSLRADGTDMYLGKKTGYAPGDSFYPYGDERATMYIASGTSMACPHVAGACALLLSVNPYLKHDDVNEILTMTADELTDANICAYGRLNAHKALLEAVSSKGSIDLDQDYYNCDCDVGIFMADSDLAEQGFEDVNITTSGGDSETVRLTETGLDIGVFTGTISTASGEPNIGDGILQVSNDKIISVTYEDADDGTGNPASPNDTAVMDCVCPVIYDVNFNKNTIGPDNITVIFDTNEISYTRVLYSESCGDPNKTSTLSLGFNHTVKLKQVSPWTDYYFIIKAVDLAGNETVDSNGGNCYRFTTDGPGDINVPGDFNTIQEAINHSWDGGRVIIDEGNYNESIEFNGKGITVTSTDPNDWDVVENTIIYYETSPGEGVVVFNSCEDSNSILAGFTVKSADPNSPNRGTCIYITSSSNPKVTNCRITDNSCGIKCVNSSPTIKNNKIFGNSLCGISCVGIGAPIIESNWIYDVVNEYGSASGINLFTDYVAVVRNNTVVGSDFGIYRYHGTAPDINNCILWNNGDDLYNCNAAYSCIENCNDAGGIGNICGDANDPMFVDPNNDDYHLDPNSPCFNAGDPNYEPEGGETDIDGDDRVMDDRVDMGADEVGCLSIDANEYDDWVAWGKPDCWCYHRQCRGDTNGATAFGKWVELADLNKLKEAFGKTDAELEEIEDGICADLDHIPTFDRRVALSDLNILNDYFGESEPNVPPCDESPVITGPYNFWTN